MTKEEAIKKVTEDGWCFKEMGEFHDDIDVAKAALKSNGYNLSHLTNRLKNNKELVLIAVNQVGMALQYASLKLQNDKEVVETAIENRPDAIDYVGSSQLDRNFYLKNIERSPTYIKNASDEIRDDKEIALLLINSKPRFIEYLSPRLQDDMEIVQIAVKQNGSLLQYASERLKDNDEIVSIAIKDNTDNYKYASKRLQEASGMVNITITNNNWDDFIKTIDFIKIEKIQKQHEDKNLKEGLRVFSFLTDFRDKLSETIESLAKYKKGKNSHPTQPQWSNDNGFRVGFYYGDKNYMPSTQLNITIGANWGGGIFIKDNKNLIFGNDKLLEFLKKKYTDYDFSKENQHIGAIWFKNDISSLPSEKDVLIAVKKLSEIFKIMIKAEEIEERKKLLQNQKQIILQGPPGTGKTRLAKQIARYIIKGEVEANIDDMKEQVKLIQFHPSYSYEDFVRGIVAKSNGTTIEYKTENKVLAKMAERAKQDLEKNAQEANKYILIIDEINRANLSSVLGELIYALEYRDEAVESMYELNDSREITLPSNLYIIGTMNTADRSIGYIDYAIRRRFTFVDVLSNENNILNSFPEGKKLYDKTIELFTDEYISPEFNIEDIKIGHSYFIAKDIEELKNKLEYQVKPLLLEYIKDGVLNENTREKVKELKFESNS